MILSFTSMQYSIPISSFLMDFLLHAMFSPWFFLSKNALGFFPLICPRSPINGSSGRMKVSLIQWNTQSNVLWKLCYIEGKKWEAHSLAPFIYIFTTTVTITPIPFSFFVVYLVLLQTTHLGLLPTYSWLMVYCWLVLIMVIGYTDLTVWATQVA